MADKQIVELPKLLAVTDETQIPVYQPGSENPAQRMSGRQFKEFGESAAAQYVQSAVNAADDAQNAYRGVKEALDNLPEGDTLIINDLTTGGTKAALSAEQGKVLGERPYHNPNLLDNWYFADPINQRGQTEYTAAGYTIDRWKSQGGYLTVNLNGAGLSFAKTSSTSAYQYFSQTIEIPTELFGSELTVSALGRSAGLFRLCVFANDISTRIAAKDSAVDGILSLTFVVPDDTNKLIVAFYPHFYEAASSTDTIVKAVKLEPGSNQTLAHQDAIGNWVLNDPPPDKGLELLRCIQSTADGSDGYSNKTILHTGNKPNGSYTGNGDATARRIATGGIGNVVAIWGGNQVTILTANGGFNYSQSTDAVTGVPFSAGRFNNGTIIIATSAGSVNANGITYNYQVL